MDNWQFPQQDEVVMDLLEDMTDPEEVWVGSWYPEVDFDGAKVIVVRLPSNTVGVTRYGQVEILVDSPQRGRARQLATEISDVLNDLPGKTVRGVLVDDVIEYAGPQVAENVDKTLRTYTMVYSLGFRKRRL